MPLPQKVKNLIWNLTYLSGLLGLVEQIKGSPKGKGLIFYYHRVHPDPGWDPFGINLYPSLFRRQMAVLKKKFSLLSLSDFFDQFKKKSPSLKTNPFAVITFDDGYRDVWDYAWPILKDFRITPAIFFCTDPLIRRSPLPWDLLGQAIQIDKRSEIATSPIILPNRIYPLRTIKDKTFFVRELNQFFLKKGGKEQKKAFHIFFETIAEKVILQTTELYLGVEQIKECQRAGIQIGAHTASHPYLPHLPGDEWEQEIRGSKIELETLIGTEVPFFAYPAGRWNVEVRDYVIQSGFRGALATGKRVVASTDQDPYTVPRISPEGVMTKGKFFALTSGVKREWFD